MHNENGKKGGGERKNESRNRGRIGGVGMEREMSGRWKERKKKGWSKSGARAQGGVNKPDYECARAWLQ